MTPLDLEFFRTYCVFQGFDLLAFDAWLSTMEGLPIHAELTERRVLAFTAARANEREAALRHLEWMLLRWQGVRRVDGLLPRARLGQRFQAGRKSGAVGVIRRFVRKYMVDHPDAKTADVWAAMKKRPPAGVEVYEASGRVAAYVTTPQGHTSRRQLANIVSQERRKED